MNITKSNFTYFLQCPRMLWLEKFRKELKTPIDEVMQNRFDEGYEVEAQAEKLFPNGVSCMDETFPGQLNKTKELIARGEAVLFQPSFSVNNLWYRGDILVKEGDGWHIYEVKSGTKPKPVNYVDLAFQKHTMEKCGHKVVGTSLILVNNKYVKQGEIKPDRLLYKLNVDGEVAPWVDLIPGYIEQAREVLQSKEEWPVKILKQCHDPYECGFKAHCWRDLPEESIYKIIKNMPDDVLAKLVEEDKILLSDLPEMNFTRKQMKQWWRAYKNGQPTINRDRIKQELDQLQYPLYFFDYETLGSGVPLVDGYRPYQQMPFQYSLHILNEPGAEFIHKEYLANSLDEIGPRLLDQLQLDVGPQGSIIAWNKSFEIGRNTEMAKLHPDYADYLHQFNTRVYDLMDIIKHGFYVDQRFYGSASIKAVLPVLAPELSYKDLDIGEGQTAMVMWKQMINGNRDKESTRKALLEYCQMDTWGMVRIWQELKNLVN